MTKRLQELSFSFLLITCGVSIILAIVWLKPVIESQRLLVEETRTNQEKIMQGAEDTKIILTELGYAVAVISMLENKMIKPVEANEMIQGSVQMIEKHSERLGKLAKILNDFRINESSR